MYFNWCRAYIIQQFASKFTTLKCCSVDTTNMAAVIYRRLLLYCAIVTPCPSVLRDSCHTLLLIAGAGREYYFAAGSVPQRHRKRSTKIHLLPIKQAVCSGEPCHVVIGGGSHNGQRRARSCIRSTKLRHVCHSEQTGKSLFHSRTTGSKAVRTIEIKLK